jgi:carbamoyltransferase
LGHRSIIFDPRGRDAKDKVNEIKKREWYRPFAGIILEEYFEEYFETLGLKSSPEMTVSFKAKQIAIDNAPGVIHVDGTCRIQTVTEGYMAEVLREYHQITGVPILLNTSFNLAGAPLVHTKQDALDTLKDSMLDYVYFVQDDALINEHLCLSFEG